MKINKSIFIKLGTIFIALAVCFLSTWQGFRVSAEVLSTGEQVKPSVGEQLYVPGQFIVKFKDQSLPEASFLQQYNLKSAKKILRQNKFAGKTIKNVEEAGLNRLYLAETDNSSLTSVLRALNQDSRVEYAEPNYNTSVFLQPNDPYFSQLWGMNNTGQTGGTADADIDAPEAWDINTNSNLVVGIIDTGIDYTHSDLADNIWQNPGEIAGNGIDDDGNGYIDDVYGWDFVNNDNNPFDDYGHGTHVAGTIAAKGNNGVGVTGVDWTAKVAALKSLGSDGSGTVADAIEALEYANMMGFKITNNSWGSSGFSQALYDAISAANSAGNLFVAAAGNNGLDTDINPRYPAAYDLSNIISVASTDHNDLKASTSNYGLTSVDLGAPGVNIYSTVPTGSCSLCNSSGYKLLSGTSMATPHVAGTAALVWSNSPSITHLAVKNAIMNSSDPVNSLAGKTVSGGRLNAYKAILAANPSRGTVSLDKNVYTVPATAAITVADLDLDITSSPDTATVELTSTTEQTPEVLDLTETGTNTGVFTGSMDLVTGTPTSDGKLQVAHADTITTTYYDADDGTGPATVTDTVIVDSQAPVISSVNSVPGETQATVTWITDEASNSKVHYGTNPANLDLTVSESTLVTSHSLVLSNLIPETTYYFDVESADRVGNTAIDNNGGLHYNFTTLQHPLTWAALGTGVGGAGVAVNASEVWQNKLYITGSFSSAGGAAASKIASWDGANWASLPSGGGAGNGLNNSGFALAVYGDKLIVGGAFTTAGGSTANRLAQWDGTVWSALETTGMSNTVNSLLIYDNKLIAGGNFTTAGGVAANRIAKWDGAAWTPMGTGFGSQVNAMVVYGSDLIVGGGFINGGGVADCDYICKWDGTAWSGIGTGVGNSVYSLTVYGGKLIAGGMFTTAGGNPALRIAQWDGAAWSALAATGMNQAPLGLGVYGSDLIATGGFTDGGGNLACDYICKWNGTAWSPMSTGLDATGRVIDLYDGALIVGGNFTSAGGISAPRIAKWF